MKSGLVLSTGSAFNVCTCFSFAFDVVNKYERVALLLHVFVFYCEFVMIIYVYIIECERFPICHV